MHDNIHKSQLEEAIAIMKSLEFNEEIIDELLGKTIWKSVDGDVSRINREELNIVKKSKRNME